MTHLLLKGASYRYEGADASAIEAADLNCSGGERWTIWGPNGSGKSTLVRLIAERYCYRDAARTKGKMEFLRENRPAKLAVVFDDAAWSFSNVFVEEELAFGLENAGISVEAMRLAVTETLGRLGLEGFERRRIATLSGGELRKLAVGVALIANPDAILTDDLPASLDFQALTEIERLLRDFAAHDAIWINFDRRWHAFSNDERPFAVIVDRKVCVCRTDEQKAAALASIGDRVGRPLSEQVSKMLLKHGVEVSVSDDIAATVEAARSGNLKFRSSYVRRRADDEALLQARKLRFHYDARCILDNADLSLYAGTITVLAGRNGTGKSTLARILAGLLRAQRGRILSGKRGIGRSRLNRLVSLVFQNPEYQFVTDSVIDEVRDAARSENVPEQVVSTTLAKFGLESCAEEHPFNLTMGEKRRLAVAVAALRRCEVLIVDEPTLGQDGEQTLLLANALRDVARAGVSVLVITHDPDFIALIADKLFELKDGRCLEHDPHEWLLSEESRAFERSSFVAWWRAARIAGIAAGVLPRSFNEIEVAP